MRQLAAFLAAYCVSTVAVAQTVADAAFRQFNPSSISDPWTDPDEVEPLDRVYLDGRGSSSSGTIVAYEWSIISAPGGANPDDYAPEGNDTALFSFNVQLAGAYDVRLRVTDDQAISDEDVLTVLVVPSQRLLIQLLWDNAHGDMDLHLARPEDALCSATACYYGTCFPTDSAMPIWDAESAGGSGGNPSLDIDDLVGFGPENISIDQPLAGRYRVFVHFFYGDVAAIFDVPVTVRIFFDGAPLAEYTRLIDENYLWAVAEITVCDDHAVAQDPGQDPSGPGQLATMFECNPPAAAFGWVAADCEPEVEPGDDDGASGDDGDASAGDDGDDSDEAGGDNVSEETSVEEPTEDDLFSCAAGTPVEWILLVMLLSYAWRRRWAA